MMEKTGISMRILYIVPMPPPITGQSLAVQVLHDHLRQFHSIEVVNFSKRNIRNGIKRLFEVLPIVWQTWHGKRKTDVIYLTISESFFGNMKDVLLYLACAGHLSRMYIHLHGGTIKRELWDRHSAILSLNRFFIRRLAGVIISGPSHLPIFDQMIERKRVHIVPNFAQDHLFADEAAIRVKFTQPGPLRMLYISAMIELKGYEQLADAYLSLSGDRKRALRIDFAGKFESKAEEDAFLGKIKDEQGLRYHGIVGDERKRALFAQAHAFCLPTSFLEGQPISILEAYAAGCIVLTTGKAGIRDIFVPGVNGYLIKEREASEVAAAIAQALDNVGTLLPIAMENRRTAGEKYRTTTYANSLRQIIELPAISAE